MDRRWLLLCICLFLYPEVPRASALDGEALSLRAGPLPRAGEQAGDIRSALRDYRNGDFKETGDTRFFGDAGQGRWFMIPLSIPSGKADQESACRGVILRVENYLLDAIDVYVLRDEDIIADRSGGVRGSSVRYHLGYATHDFAFTLAGGDYRLFMRIVAAEAFLPIRLLDLDNYGSLAGERDVLFALFYSVIFAVLMATVFAYFTAETRRGYYVLHFLFLLSYLSYQLSRDGVLNGMLWPGNAYLIHRYYLFATTLSLFFLQTLVMAFLCAGSRHPRIYRFLRLNLAVPAAAALVLVFLPEAYLTAYQGVARVVLLYVLVLMSLTTVPGLFSRDAADRLFSVGLQVAIGSIIIAVLKAKGVLPYADFQLYALTGVMVEGILFLLAVSLRLGDIARGKRRVEASLREANQRLLQSRGRPHFLLNTFGMIRSMLQDRRDTAEEAFSCLIEDYRFFTHRALLPLIPAAEELAFIRNYLRIMDLRYASALRAELTTDTPDPDSLLPPLSLQPLVENAYKYGTRPGVVSIALTRQGEVLRFQVAEAADLGDQEAFPFGETHRNILERMRYYHPGATLRLHVQGGQFLATLEWPASGPDRAGAL